MTPEEKAKELVERFSKQQINESSFENFQVAKECALICVDEMIYTLDTQANGTQKGNSVRFDIVKYWQQVKQAIEKL